MTAVYEHEHDVTASEIDVLGHVGNIEYLRWTQEAAMAHSAVQGWPADAYDRLGAGWVVRSHEIQYRLPAFVGDHLVIRTWVANMRKVTSLRKFRILRPADGAVLVTACTNWAFVSYNTRSLIAIPPEVSGAFQIMGDEFNA